MAANDYYDFNPSPGAWALLLSGMVLFVLVLSVLLIYFVDRGQATGRQVAARPESVPTPLPAPSGTQLTDRRSA